MGLRSKPGKMSRKRLTPATLGEWYRCSAKRTRPTVHICEAVRVSNELISSCLKPGTRSIRLYVAAGATSCPAVTSTWVGSVFGRVRTPRRRSRPQA
jgi:hypothetical protein